MSLGHIPRSQFQQPLFYCDCSGKLVRWSTITIFSVLVLLSSYSRHKTCFEINFRSVSTSDLFPTSVEVEDATEEEVHAERSGDRDFRYIEQKFITNKHINLFG